MHVPMRMLSSSIHDAFCKISTLIRLDTARLRTTSDIEDIKTLVKECQLVFTFIPSAEDDVSHSQRLFAFHGERRCDNINAQLLALKNTAKETKVVTPPGKILPIKPKPGVTDFQPPTPTVLRPCIKNLLQQ